VCGVREFSSLLEGVVGIGLDAWSSAHAQATTRNEATGTSSSSSWWWWS